MREQQRWEEVVEQLKQGLPVNQELKRTLRAQLLGEEKIEANHLTNQLASSGHGRHQDGRYWKWGLVVVAAASIVLTLLWNIKEKENQVLASSLHLFDQYSLQQQLGNEQSEGMAEYNGIVYLPMNKEGLFQLDNTKLTKLIDGNINYVRVSPNGEQLIYVEQDQLHLYSIKNGKSQLLLTQEKGNGLGRLSTPAWSEDGQQLLFVSSESTGNNEQKNEIMRMTIADKQWKKITSGISPNFVAGQEGIFFERNKQIIYLDLDTKEERVLDSGQMPAVSNDGNYVAYIKATGNPELQDLWIADSNFKTKKQITSNQVMDYAFDPKTGDSIEGKQQARYTLDQPVWSNEDNRLYVYKVFHTNVTWRKLTRLQLSTVKLTAGDIVGSSIAALIYRDEEYAHSFFSFDPGYLKGTNPRQVGYRIRNSKQQGDKTIVEADTYLANADPYYQVEKQRYTVVDTPTGYKISALESLGWLEINDQKDGIYLTKYAPGENNVVSSNSNDVPKENTLLLLHTDIPQQQGWKNGSISSLQYNEQQQQLFLTMHRTRGGDTKIVLFDYNLHNKDFKEYTIWQGKGSGRSVLLQINNDQSYAAVNIEFEKEQGDLIIADLATGRTASMASYTNQIGYSLVPRYWNNNNYVFYWQNEVRALFYTYDPQKATLVYD